MAESRVVGEIDNVAKRSMVTSAPALPRFTSDQVCLFRPMLGFLNAKDRDILYLVFVTGKKQKDVCRILDRTQPGLSYDIKRIRRRLQYIFYLHSVFDVFVGFIDDHTEIMGSQEAVFSEVDLHVLTLMFYTSSFAISGRVMGKAQVRVRITFDNCLRKMEENELWEVYEIFQTIRSNLNVVRRVYDPDQDLVSRGWF